MVVRKSKAEKRTHEAHPNLPGKRGVAQTPLRTDHGKVTGQNLPQSPTVENQLNTSVSLEDPTDDSMFNLADPQARQVFQRDRSKAPKKNRIA